jgi:hypothetical protein
MCWKKIGRIRSRNIGPLFTALFLSLSCFTSSSIPSLPLCSFKCLLPLTYSLFGLFFFIFFRIISNHIFFNQKCADTFYNFSHVWWVGYHCFAATILVKETVLLTFLQGLLHWWYSHGIEWLTDLLTLPSLEILIKL